MFGFDGQTACPTGKITASVLKYEDNNNKQGVDEQLSIFARFYNSEHSFINSSEKIIMAAYTNMKKIIE